MFGTLSKEVEVKVAADKAWQLYGTSKLKDIALKYILDEHEIIEDNGSVNTVIDVTLKPEYEISCYKKRYMILDNERKVREGEIIEGAHMEFGFTFCRVRYEVKDNPNDGTSSTCLVKATIEYEVTEEATANTSLVAIKPYFDLMKFANQCLLSQG